MSGPARGAIPAVGLRVGWILALLALVIGVARAAPAAGVGAVMARAGSITVTATSLRPVAPGTLTSHLSVTTTASDSDQLDAALAPGHGAVGVYHRQVSVGEIPDLASCDGDIPPAGVVDRWLHDGPMLVPGRANGPSPPATATLALPPEDPRPSGSHVAVTLYFARAGSLTLDLAVQRI